MDDTLGAPANRCAEYLTSKAIFDKMRVLLYGMQSSGASLITYFLGQRRRSFVLIDLWSWELVPPLHLERVEHVVAKCTLTTLHTFQQHVDVFQPDRTVLVLRDAAQNYMSLSRKPYCDESGLIDDKFRKLEEVFHCRDQFDLVLTYEDFVRRPRATVSAFDSIDIHARLHDYMFPRSRKEILSFNFDRSQWARDHYKDKWGFGNVQGSELRAASLYREVPEEVRARVRDLCPAVVDFYETRGPAQDGPVEPPVTGVVNRAFAGTRAALGRLRG